MYKALVRLARSAPLRGAFILIAALIAVPAAQAAGMAISIDNFTFSPQRLVVTVGTTLTWTNRDDIPHTVVASGKEFRSKVLDTDDTFTFTFTTPGSYEYFCSLHPHMTGMIVVDAEPALPSP
jgi:plastocyanin